MSIVRPMVRGLVRPMARALVKGGGGDPIASYFAGGGTGFDYQFSETDRLWQTTSALAAADDAGESIGLVLDASRLDGRGVVNRMFQTDQFNVSPWTRRGTCTVTANAEGVADLIAGVNGPSNGNDLFQQVTIAGSAAYRPSMEIKKVTASGTLSILNPAGTGDYTVDFSLLGSDYERITADHPAVTVNASPVATAGGAAGIFLKAASGGPLSFYLRSAQVDAGTSVSAYQANGATLGGPGNHAWQTTAGSRVILQADDSARGDGSADGLFTTKTMGAAGFVMIKHVTYGPPASTKVMCGASGSATAYGYCGIDSAGFPVARIGTGTEMTGDDDVTGAVGTIGFAWNGSNAYLLVNGERVKSQAQSGAPTTTIPLALFCMNSNGTLADFLGTDIYRAIHGDTLPSDAMLLSFHNKMMSDGAETAGMFLQGLNDEGGYVPLQFLGDDNVYRNLVWGGL